MHARTSDIAFAIRDFIDDQHFQILELTEDGYYETGHAVQVIYVDTSDVNNLVVTLDNNQRFKISIVAI